MTYNRQPLRDRPKPLSVDVADAIEQIVEADDDGLPIAIDKAMIVDTLIKIAQTNEEDIYVPPSGPAGTAMTREFTNIITNTATFQSGYKRYEERAEHPVVPVTDYFFRVVYGGGGVSDVLDAMTDFEIVQSLPKRRGKVDDGSSGFLRDEQSGEVLTFGELAGIVVFPAEARHKLLRAWLQRRANMAEGQLNGAVSAIEHARPGSTAVENLKAASQTLTPALTRALPAPAETAAMTGPFQYEADEVMYNCRYCDELFDAVVWHCRVCNHHWPMGRTDCHNCHTGKRPRRALGSCEKLTARDVQKVNDILKAGGRPKLTSMVKLGNANRNVTAQDCVQIRALDDIALTRFLATVSTLGWAAGSSALKSRKFIELAKVEDRLKHVPSLEQTQKFRGLDDFDVMMIISDTHDHGWADAVRTMDLAIEASVGRPRTDIRGKPLP